MNMRADKLLLQGLGAAILLMISPFSRPWSRPTMPCSITAFCPWAALSGVP